MSTIKYYDTVAGIWKTITGAPPDAPSDGKLYGRKNGAWAEINFANYFGQAAVISVVAIPDAPTLPPTTISYV